MGEKNAAADIRELYKEMVPKVRKILPADRYAIFLSFVYPDAIEESGPWLEQTISDGPSHVWCNVIYDRHLYHAYGDDDNKQGPPWNPDMDKCKTCCRDPVTLNNLGNVHFAIGEWSLTTGTVNHDEHTDRDFLNAFWQDQVSMWKNQKGARGAFFWTHRIMPKTGKPDWFLPFSLLDMITGPTQLKKISDLDHSERCPNTDLTKCPAFDAKTLGTTFGGSAQCQFTGAWQKEQMRLI